MDEHREIEKAQAIRAAAISTEYDRVRFQRDFSDCDWFHEHPSCEPIQYTISTEGFLIPLISSSSSKRRGFVENEANTLTALNEVGRKVLEN